MIVGVFPSGAADPANRASPRLPNHYTMIVGVFPSGAADPANRASPRLPNHYIIDCSACVAHDRFCLLVLLINTPQPDLPE